MNQSNELPPSEFRAPTNAERVAAWRKRVREARDYRRRHSDQFYLMPPDPCEMDEGAERYLLPAIWMTIGAIFGQVMEIAWDLLKVLVLGIFLTVSVPTVLQQADTSEQGGC